VEELSVLYFSGSAKQNVKTTHQSAHTLYLKIQSILRFWGGCWL